MWDIDVASGYYDPTYLFPNKLIREGFPSLCACVEERKKINDEKKRIEAEEEAMYLAQAGGYEEQQQQYEEYLMQQQYLMQLEEQQRLQETALALNKTDVDDGTNGTTR